MGRCLLSGQTQLASIASTAAVSGDNLCLIKYSSHLVDELTNLLTKKQRFETLLIDARDSGFLFPLTVFLEIVILSTQLLQVQGTFILVKSDKALTLRRDSLIGDLSFRIFPNFDELFHFSPSLFKQLQNALGQEETSMSQSTDLAQQILFSCVPVLTIDGIKLKASRSDKGNASLVLSAIDNYTPLSAISMRLAESSRMTVDEMLAELKKLEAKKAVYPLFAKIPFLADCFRNRVAFTIKDYFLAAGIITQAQLDGLMVGAKPVGQDWKHLGALLLKMGYVSARQLEIAMQELAFYGQKGSLEASQSIKVSNQEALMQTMVGYLGTTDPANLLQNFVQNRYTGVLSVEHGDSHFRAQFEEGKLTHAKVGKITGNRAILEFASRWKEGIFVFIQRQPPPDLATDACKVTKILDKLLLESALAKDNMETDKKPLPNGLYTILEKLPDENKLLENKQQPTTLMDPKENVPLNTTDITMMSRLWIELDGLTKLDEAIKKLGDMALFEGVRAANLLMHNGLAHLPTIDLSKTLEKFNLVCSRVAEKIGQERSVAFLRLSRRDALGYSLRGRMFIIGMSGEPGIDQSAAHHAHASLSQVSQDFEDWQVKYIEYVSQEIDASELMSIIQQIHN